MPYIYKITNLINNKIYIGKTVRSLHERWLEHCRCTDTSRPLYRAFHKYGLDNFKFEPIEECSLEQINERERYWISYYDTYHNGYNATIGGDGSVIFDYDYICEIYEQTHNQVLTSQICNCCVDTVRNALRVNNINILDSNEVNQASNGKPVGMYNDNQLIQSFVSIKAAAEYLCQQGISKGERRGTSTHISEVARGKRKTAYGYVWKFLDTE